MGKLSPGAHTTTLTRRQGLPLCGQDWHQIFLEPEGYESDIVYPNGISTSLPADIQDKFVRLIPGLENCEILKMGYAVEYDFVDPRNLLPLSKQNLSRASSFGPN